MSVRKENIDEYFRREMGSHTEAPPPAVWEALESRLDNEPPRRKRPFAIWWVWSVAGLLLISASVIIANHLMSEQKQATAVHTENKNVPENIINNAEPAPAREPIEEQQAQEPTQQPAPENDDNTIATNNTPKQGNTQYNTNNNRSDKTDISTTTNNVTTQTTPTPRNPEQKMGAMPNRQISALAQNPTEPAHKNMVTVPEPDKPTDELSVLTPAKPNGVSTSAIIAGTEIKGKQLNMPDVKVVIPAADAVTSAGKDEARQMVAISNRNLQNIPVPSSFDASAAQGKMPYATAPSVVEAPAVIAPQAALDSPDKKFFGKTAIDSLFGDDDEDEKIVREKNRKRLPLEAGIKLGYNKGFNSTWRADKFVAGAYVAYNLPHNFSIVFQPSYQFGNAKTGAIGNPGGPYYEITGSSLDSVVETRHGYIDSSVLTPNPPDTVFRTYRYGQTYDSITVKYGVTQSRLWDVELPLILKYRINKYFSVYGGGTATYSAVLQTEERIDRYAKSRSFTQAVPPETYYVTVPNQQPPPGPGPAAHSSVFQYQLDPFNNYQPYTTTPSNVKTFFRYGFILGVSADISDRWMVDVLMQKSGADASKIPDANIRKIYTQPYFRFTVGYKLLK